MAYYIGGNMKTTTTFFLQTKVAARLCITGLAAVCIVKSNCEAAA